MSPLYVDTSLDLHLYSLVASSTTVCCAAARPDLSQTLLQLLFQIFHKLIQSGLLPTLVGNSFISFWAS